MTVWPDADAAGLEYARQATKLGHRPMIPIREPVARVVMQGWLMRVLRMIAPVLGLTLANARDLARSVLADAEPDNPNGDDGDSARPR